MGVTFAMSERFSTERLLARRVVPGDEGGLNPALLSEGLQAGFGLSVAPDPERFVERSASMWEAGSCYTFALIDEAGRQTVGFARITPAVFANNGLRTAEPEIALAPAFCGRGFAYEAMCELLGWAFGSLRYPQGQVIDEVRAACLPSNEPSLKLLAKLAKVGMRDLGEQEVHQKTPGDLWGTQVTAGHVFAVTREEFESRRPGKSEPPAS